ncbi:putative YopX protein [Pseudoalteromonas virus vB_PspP-H6/1]|nr:putative YopX protein [Pseudoalteromonas virus vB_PspP-H6/1]
MRELKFRAWHKNLKRFAPENCNIQIQGDDSHVSFDTFTGNFDTEVWHLVDCELIQYTGLKDKNGEEIYEGDIVKTDYDNGYEVFTHVVKWGGTSYPAFDLSPSLNCESNGLSHVYDCGDTSIEIIGNIYENPELLK